MAMSTEPEVSDGGEYESDVPEDKPPSVMSGFSFDLFRYWTKTTLYEVYTFLQITSGAVDRWIT
jgi:hypothetical protein